MKVNFCVNDVNFVHKQLTGPFTIKKLIPQHPIIRGRTINYLMYCNNDLGFCETALKGSVSQKLRPRLLSIVRKLSL